MAKHLIIGLGGTGGNVICELRKRIYESVHNSERTAEDVYVDFLYVDSSKEDLLGIDKEGKPLIAFKKKWSTQGQSIKLEPQQVLYIGGLESDKIASLHRFNNLNSFYTEQDKEDTAKGMGAIIGAGIGGQRRRFGRMLFSNNSTSENSFLQRIANRMDSLHAKAKEHGDNTGNVTFHICAGLGGGTGSGTIIDTISQIRHTYPQDGNEDQYRICLYLYLPEAIKNAERDREGFYRPNGYAALSELNALSVGAYQPIDITDKRDTDREEKRIRDAGFEAAYVYTNRNYVGNQYGLDELPHIAADFLFQKLFSGISPRFEANENVGATPEDINGTPVHSRKFLSFGIKRLIYPETEIKEYASYVYAYVGAMQMVYGWPKGAQFPVELTPEKVNVSPNEVCGTDDNHPMRQTLHLTDRLLRVDSEYFSKYQELASKAKWQGFITFWDTLSKNLYSQIISREDFTKDQWLGKFNQGVMSQYTSYFRGNGVDNFFTNCRSDKSMLTDEVVNHIGTYLLEQWKLGKKSMMEVVKFLDILIDDCRKRYDRCDDDITNSARLAQKFNKDAGDQAKEFMERGILSDLFNRSTKIFERYTQLKGRALAAQTQKVACEFAKELMASIIDGLVSMRAEADQFCNLLIKYIESQDSLRISTCREGDGGYKADSEVVKLYKPSDIRALIDIFAHEEDKQKDNIQEMRSNILEGIAYTDNFKGLNLRYKDVDDIQDIANPVCWVKSETRMREYALENPNQKIINVNVLEKLHEENDWERILERMCKDALVLIEKDGMEDGADKILTSMAQIGLPKFDDQRFKDAVEAKLKGVLAGEGYNAQVYETTHSQLVILTGKSSFPVRYVRSVKKLKESYDEFTKNSISNYKIVHTESFARQLPSLYNKTEEELRKELYRVLLVVYCVPGILAKETDKDTGEVRDAVACKQNASGTKYCYNREDRPDDMASSFVFMGADIRKSMERLTKREGDVTMLVDLVDKQLAEKYRHNSKKKELVDEIRKFLKTTVSEAFDNNMTDRELQEYVKAADMLSEKELKQKI